MTFHKLPIHHAGMTRPQLCRHPLMSEAHFLGGLIDTVTAVLSQCSCTEKDGGGDDQRLDQIYGDYRIG
jgi:hypothetical protein